ncbi:MAG TPA: LLM class flavin-dependent oxidoreductase [Reyranella sp.]|jgi:alkanesulfonate monooxygenase SsuD/methylene tetrahydromethanopterin reductase-like flavin-dependent oxidoreductase (luciferase family)
MIKPWIFEFFGAPAEFYERFDASRSLKYFEAYLDLWASAEPAGFEGIFFSEHHFGAGYSPAPNLLIAGLASRTKTMRLGTLGMVAPYHAPWHLIEEIGMLDHLTGGRLEIGTAAGIPNEMAKVGLSPDEARARNDEVLEILDAALKNPVISYHGKFWNFDNLRLTPRPVQKPAPPVWVTVVSESSARKAARRGAKLCTGFHPLSKIVDIFDAFRDEARKMGRRVGPEDLCIRRQVTMLGDGDDAAAVVDSVLRNMRKYLEADPRLDTPDRPAVLDTPTAHAFSIGDDEVIAGTTDSVAAQIIEQCSAAGAGHFAANFNRSQPPEALKAWYGEYGRYVIPRLRSANQSTQAAAS